MTPPSRTASKWAAADSPWKSPIVGAAAINYVSPGKKFLEPPVGDLLRWADPLSTLNRLCNLVVVVTAGARNGEEQRAPQEFLYSHILKALQKSRREAGPQ